MTMMKFCTCCIIFLISMCIIYTQQQVPDPVFKAKVDKVVAECEVEIGIDVAIVRKAWTENHFPNDEKIKCFFKCFNIKLGVMNEAGDVIDDVLSEVTGKYNDESTKDEIVKECGAISGSNLCDTAMKLTACIKAAILD